MAKEKKVKESIAQQLMKEATAEIDEEYKKAWKSELKVKIRQLRNAQQLANNIAREIEDLELRIGDELGQR